MRKRKKLAPKSARVDKTKPPIIEEKERLENPMDFGGIELRDLKKNLGCG